MGDGYWSRQPPPMHQSAGLLKRPRNDYDLSPSGVPPPRDMHNYLAHDDDRGGSRVMKDSKTLGSAYDRYLQSSQTGSFPAGESSGYSGLGLGRAAGMGSMPGLQLRDQISSGRAGSTGLDLPPNGRGLGYGGQVPADSMSRHHDTLPLPSDASNTLYIEGLPPDSTKREVAHIFRPFVGYREVRLVRKESKHRGGDPLILCFVDFEDAACAATALSALQVQSTGYKMDEHDPDSSYLRLQFSRNPGPRAGGPVSRGRR